MTLFYTYCGQSMQVTAASSPVTESPGKVEAAVVGFGCFSSCPALVEVWVAAVGGDLTSTASGLATIERTG
jgi:hypothetical protein